METESPVSLRASTGLERLLDFFLEGEQFFDARPLLHLGAVTRAVLKNGCVAFEHGSAPEAPVKVNISARELVKKPLPAFKHLVDDAKHLEQRLRAQFLNTARRVRQAAVTLRSCLLSEFGMNTSAAKGHH